MSAATIAGIVVVIAIVVLVISVMAATRRRRLQRRFGPEYDRVVKEKQSQRKADAELASRERRVQHLDIRPLTPAARARYAAGWADVQERFVDQPQQAVTEAQQLVVSVMTDRGYPAEGDDQIVADLSVEHAATLDRYRAAQDISTSAAAGTASTEDLRQAMIHYRALFGELLGHADEPGPGAAGAPPADTGPADTEPADTGPADTGPAGPPSARPTATVPPARRPVSDTSAPSGPDDPRTSYGEVQP
jgi:Tfp pilus assembly protein PilX